MYNLVYLFVSMNIAPVHTYVFANIWYSFHISIILLPAYLYICNRYIIYLYIFYTRLIDTFTILPTGADVSINAISATDRIRVLFGGTLGAG